MVQVSIIVPLSRNAGAVWPELRQILNEYGSEIEVVCVASSRKAFPLGSSFFSQSALSSASPKVSCFNASFSRENSLQSLPEDMMQDGRLRFVRAPGTEKYAAMNIGLEESWGEYVASGSIGNCTVLLAKSVRKLPAAALKRQIPLGRISWSI